MSISNNKGCFRIWMNKFQQKQFRIYVIACLLRLLTTAAYFVPAAPERTFISYLETLYSSFHAIFHG